MSEENVNAAVLADEAANKDNAKESADPSGGDPQANAEQGGNAPDEHKRKGGWQRKIEKLERESEFWREEALRSRTAKPSEPEPKPVVAEDPEPDADKYEDTGKYLRDLAKWEARNTVRAEISKRDEAAQKAREEEEEKTNRKSVEKQWKERVEAASTDYEDFDDVAYSPDVPYSQAMTEVVAQSELGPHVAYFLGKNPDEAKRISELSPLAAARELGKIEARIASQRESAEAPEKPEPAPVTKAPAPAVPVRKPSAAADTELRDDLPQKEWMKRREADIQRKNK